MKKGRIVVTIAGIAIIITAGIVGDKIMLHKGEEVVAVDSTNTTPSKYVHNKVLTEESYVDEVSYSGYVMADETKKFAFEMAGTVNKVYVKKGQSINKGDLIATLDTRNIELGLQKSKEDADVVRNSASQLELGIEAEELTLEKMKTTYDSNITQAQIQYDQQKDMYDRNRELYEQGGIGKVELDNMESALKVAEEQLENLKLTKQQNVDLQQVKIQQLKEQLKGLDVNLQQAHVGVAQNEKYINDSKLVSTIDGYVLDVVTNEGEITGAGNPIVIVKTKEQVINIGVPVEDYGMFSKNMQVTIKTDNGACKGKVSTISLYPNEDTRTYDVEIIPENKDLVMGDLVTVVIEKGESKGCFIPLSAVFNLEGVDYVYKLIKDEGDEYIVKREEVKLGEVKNELILAKNLKAGDCIVDEEINNVKESDRVIILK